MAGVQQRVAEEDAVDVAVAQELGGHRRVARTGLADADGALEGLHDGELVAIDQLGGQHAAVHWLVDAGDGAQAPQERRLLAEAEADEVVVGAPALEHRLHEEVVLGAGEHPEGGGHADVVDEGSGDCGVLRGLGAGGHGERDQEQQGEEEMSHGG